MTKQPCIISLSKIGSEQQGFISIAQLYDDIPFDIKRVYWTYNVPPNFKRGYHAHKKLNQVIIAMNGELKINLISVDQKKYEYILNCPSKGLLIPEMYWREIKFSKDAILLCLASEYYDEKEYIRVFQDFIGTKN